MVKTLILEFSPLQNKILRLLCIQAGNRLNLSDIAQRVKATPAGVAKALGNLKRADLISVDKSSSMNLTLVTLARNTATTRQKRIENLQQIHDTTVIDFLEENFPGCTIILFGSYSRGDDTVRSDVDIAIIGAKQRVVNLSAYEKQLQRTINLQFYGNLSSVHKELRENLCNGIVLSGGIQL